MPRFIFSLVVAGVAVLFMGPQAIARDLWGDAGIILSAEKTAVLMRVARLSPETRLDPVIIEEVPVLTTAVPGDDPQADQSITEDITEQVTIVPSGNVLTAPPIPGWDSEFESAEALQKPNLSAEETRPEAPMISDDEFDMASVYDPAITLPPNVDPLRQDEPRSPSLSFGSGAFTGLYGGVGQAGGMRLEIETSGFELTGWFIDSAGQVFSVFGELASEDGRAQAAVISADTAVGYFDLQLTNLGLGVYFVPLAEDMTPMVDAAREYEFLRTLSPEAQSALEAGRSAREADAESVGHTSNQGTSPLQSSYPEDDDPFN